MNEAIAFENNQAKEADIIFRGLELQRQARMQVKNDFNIETSTDIQKAIKFL